MRKITGAMLIAVGIIHLLPLSGVMGAEQLASLYGLDFQEPSLAILMRHRAILFGLLGIFLVCAAFRRALQLPAFVAGFVSVVSFLAFAYADGDHNAAIGRVVTADWLAFACLLVGAGAAGLGRTKKQVTTRHPE